MDEERKAECVYCRAWVLKSEHTYKACLATVQKNFHDAEIKMNYWKQQLRAVARTRPD